MTSRGLERAWIRTGGYGRFRGEWVKLASYIHMYYILMFDLSYNGSITTTTRVAKALIRGCKHTQEVKHRPICLSLLAMLYRNTHAALF